MRTRERSLSMLVGMAAVLLFVGLLACQAAPLSDAPADAQTMLNRACEIARAHPEAVARAIPVVEQVLSKYPGTRQAAQATAYLGIAYAMLGDTGRSDEYRKALEQRYPGSEALGEYWAVLGEIRCAGKGENWQSEVEAALPYFAKSQAILINHLSSWKSRLMLKSVGIAQAQIHAVGHREKQAGDTLRALAKILRGHPEEIGVWAALAEEIGTSPRETYGLALVHLDGGAIGVDDQVSQAAAMLGAAHYHINHAEFDQAAAVLAKLGAAPSSPHAAAVALGNADLARAKAIGKPAEWLPAYLDVLTRFPADPRAARAYFMAAQAQRALARSQEAEALLTAIRDNASFYPDHRGSAAVSLAEMHLAAGRRSDAIAAYQKARVVGAESSAAWNAVSQLDKLGEKVE